MARKDWAPIVARAAEIVRSYETAVTLRQVHYRLVAEAELTDSGYRNTESDYKNLSRLTAAARRDGEFPPLLDRTRTIDRPTTYESPREALDAIAYWYRRDLLETQDARPVIVVEKATLIAQVQSWFDAFWGVPIVALRGYASETLERQVLEFADSEDGGRSDAVFLYCGDFDPTGEDIPRAFEHNTGLTLRRVALTTEQVAGYRLPVAMGKTTDSRAAGFELRHGRLLQVELEALDPDDLQALLRTELSALIDQPRVEAVAVRQARERDRLAELAASWEDDNAS
jgi:hypothetical protein